MLVIIPLLPLQDLTYSVRNNQNRKELLYLLKGVTGYFQPRRMTALVGWVLLIEPFGLFLSQCVSIAVEVMHLHYQGRLCLSVCSLLFRGIAMTNSTHVYLQWEGPLV